MDQLVALHPGKELHVVLDNLSSHLVEKEKWAKQHPQVHFHYTPTHASWLNQVEIWFSILTEQALRGASFRSVKQLMPQWMPLSMPTTNLPHLPMDKGQSLSKIFASKYSNSSTSTRIPVYDIEGARIARSKLECPRHPPRE